MLTNKLRTDEKGQAFIFSLILLLVGALIITPLLGLMSTGLIAGQANETKMNELYAADAGVEDALWQLFWGALDVPEGPPVTLTPLLMNTKTVNTTITKIVGEPEYKITSTAGNLTIVSYVRRILSIGGDFVLDPGERLEEDVYYSGNITLGDGAEIRGTVIAGGDIVMDADSEIRGGVIAGGSVTLSDGAQAGEAEVRGSVCAGGDITVGDGVRIRGSVYTPFNLILGSGVEIEGDAYVGGDIIGDDTQIDGDIFPYTDCPLGVDDEVFTWSVS